jgi:hypothetical protein
MCFIGVDKNRRLDYCNTMLHSKRLLAIRFKHASLNLFSIVCGLATDFALIHRLIARLFANATDEFAHKRGDILLATVMEITHETLWSCPCQILILQTTQNHGAINGCEAVSRWVVGCYSFAALLLYININLLWASTSDNSIGLATKSSESVRQDWQTAVCFISKRVTSTEGHQTRMSEYESFV